MKQILNLDTQLFLYLNSLHANWLDPIMEMVTRRDTWFPAYLVLIIWLIYQQKKQAAFTIISIILAVAFSDQLCSSVLKPLVARLRPCHEPALQGLIHMFTECGGQYGFCSSHAANGFAFAVSLMLFFGKNKYTYLVLLWAVIISYSRIYVGVHYPLDVICGGFIGSCFAYLSFIVICFAKKRYFA
jgi:undecaprenyl-diphosphatase